jgi:hypothetical protein
MPLRRVTLADLAPGRSRVADLIMQGGQTQADAVLRGGEGWASAFGNISQQLGGALQQSAKANSEQEVQRAVRLATSQGAYPSATKPAAGSAADVADPSTDHMAAILDRLSPEDRPLAIKGIREIQSYGAEVQQHNLQIKKLQGELSDAEAKRKTVAADYGAGLGKQISQWLPKTDGGLSAATFAFGHAQAIGTQGIEEFKPVIEGLSQEWEAAQASGDPAAIQAAAEKNRATIGPLAQKLQMGGSPEWQEKNQRKGIAQAEGTAIVDPVNGAVISPATPRRETRSLDVQRAEALAAGDTAKADNLLKQMQQEAAAKRDPLAGQKDKFWVMRDGKPLRISESEYRPGDKPANTREQGRPVTSGDAGRIAEMDTALDEANALAEKITGNKATGVRAKIGTMVPNVVTELTGWGADAKAKEGTINLVKQIIGKGLEGGVLRKEDETKYAKILPTIGDSQEVVAAKIDGLWKALQQKRQNQLDSLSDAGYDTTKYSERAPRERTTSEAASGGVSVLAPDGKTYRFASKAQADVFKKRAGIK